MSDKLTGHQPLDLASIRARLQAAGGMEYWRSLEELADTEEFKEFLHNEFPRLSAISNGGLPRRDLLRLLGASLALAGMSACTQAPLEKIVPYVRAPEDLVPGKPLFYATAMALDGYATGILVESHLGRPTKVEGNPQHPASLGAADAFAQASILSLYDPDRSQIVMRNGRPSSLLAMVADINIAREEQSAKKGAGLRILTGTVTSPALAWQIQSLLEEFPQAKWHQYDPAGRHAERAGAKLAFGEHLNTIYKVREADVILSLDSDLLSTGPGSLVHARDWAARRQGDAGIAGMNRLYVVESTPSNTGAVADHRLPIRAADIEGFARSIAKTVGVEVEAPSGAAAHASWVAAVTADLKAHRGRSLVVPGCNQPPSVHALAHAMNQVLGNVGKTVEYTEPVEARPVDQIQSLVELVEEMKGGRVDLMVIFGQNPVFDAPADLDFPLHLSKVKKRIHLGLYQDETSRLCHWHVPEAHFLETWGDVRSYEGTVSIVQPLIAPLYDGKSAYELMSVLLGKSGVSGHETVREYWKSKHPEGNFEEFWQVSLHDGFMAGTKAALKMPMLQPGWAKALAANGKYPPATNPQSPTPGLEIIFRPDPTIWDGRFANNGWLQELPKPWTRLTWDNVVQISPGTAERLKLRSREVVEIQYRGGTVRAPVWITPGHAADSATVHYGYGRSQAGKVGTGAGFNAYVLRTSDRPWFGHSAELRKTGTETILACTQNHQSMEGRNLYREGTVGEFEHNREFVHEMGEEPARDLTLYPGFEYKGYAWGMAVNLGACIGCNACVVACQAENNIPVVGKEQVNNGRGMHWIRIDRYHKGELENPSTHFQPVMCQHCENAPCEPVCPVAATSHSSEGLNQMVYNRCVGTRYCSNNCPYKVRRFNFLQFSDWETPSLKPMRNPDVTVRGRGVMEKCSFCVQRISAAKILAEKENREVRDGEVVTACQASCPTGAIVFGNINDPESRVAKLKAQPLNYGLLAELNTRPRASYLARLRNPNPSLERG